MDLGHVWTDDSESKKFCGTFLKVARRRHFLKEMVSSFSGPWILVRKSGCSHEED